MRTGKNSTIAPALLKWYDHAQRTLPWRREPGDKIPSTNQHAYEVWLSEIMLQQTTVRTVIPYYQKFLSTWPTVSFLARAPQSDILKTWAGLGYYSRARNLHKCAQIIVAEHGGIFPRTEKDLLRLPGIGSYTAAAIAAIAFSEPATVVDGNVERVIARLFALKTPLPKAKAEIKVLAGKCTPRMRPGDYAQSMMDLGATVCTPKSPSCDLCPLRTHCRGVRLGIETDLPARSQKPKCPTRWGAAFLAVSDGDCVLLRKRAEKGLLGGMMEVPGSAWDSKKFWPKSLENAAPLKANWIAVPGFVSHTFTHFHLELVVYRADVAKTIPIKSAANPKACHWVRQADLADEALPTVMLKILRHGFLEPFPS